MGAETLDELLRALRAAVDRDVDVSPLTGVIERLSKRIPRTVVRLSMTTPVTR
jgi:hypothetical protein